jgi:hypothetical protein
MNDDFVRAELADRLRRHQHDRDAALARLAATSRPGRLGRVRAIARRVLLGLAVAAGIALLVSAFVGRPAAPTPTTIPPVTTPYTPHPAGPPNPAWPIDQPDTP